MSKVIRIVFVLLSCASAVLSTSARAGAMTGGATEVTQILNNVELVASVSKQAATVSQLAQSYVVHYQTLQQQILAGLKLNGLSLGDVMQIKSNYENYQNSLRSLGVDLGTFQNTINVRNTEAKLQNLSLLQYVQRQDQLIRNGNAQAAARVQREAAEAQQIASDIELVRSLGNKVPATEGVHGATQLMNSQMNVLLQQMTRLVRLTSEAQGSDRAAAMSKEANDRESARAIADQIISNENAIRARNQQMIEGMRPAAP
jgi:conjugal transfer/entry exclusion protein